MPAQDSLQLLPRHRDLIAACAEAAVARFANTLPDLRRAVILMPHYLQQGRLRECVLAAAQARGHAAVLPPTVATFRTLFRERASEQREQPALSAHECKLLLATALDEHPDLLPRAGRWEFADELLRLFDEIADSHPQVQTQDAAAGLAAGLVQTLYEVWREDRAQAPDVQTLYRGRLRRDTLTHADEHVFLCGFVELSACESAWAARLYQQGRLTLIAHVGAGGHYTTPVAATVAAIVGDADAPTAAPDSTALGDLLDAAFADNATVAARARDAAARNTVSPAAAKIRVFKPESLEQHAFGIYTKIRDWLDAGIAPVAVVSQDRKLSRRLRAVLERADIPLWDHAGWALSTTASAAAVSALLPAAEQGFGDDIVLTLARSPYCRYGLDEMRAQKAGAHLERALAELEPFRNFDETIAALATTDAGDETAAADSAGIVTRIRDALDGLRRLAASAERHPFSTLFETLFAAMDALDMTAALQKDAAGQRLLEELEAMAGAAHAQGGAGGWSLWRRWILHTFERENFIPKEHAHLVELYSLPQSLLARPAALVIAALDSGHTSPAEPLPLLDEDARRALGLKGRNWRVALQFDRFRTALENAERVLLTCQRSDNGQALTPAPWLDGLQHFHALAYGDNLEEAGLQQRAQAEMRAAATAYADAPARPQMPAPRLPAWPERLSVGTVQAAVACPYRFFAKASLRLAPAPAADDYDSARSYGVRLHRCLATLHTRMDRPWVAEHRDYALALAHDVAAAEFAPYLDRHYSVAERMGKAQEAMCWYVDWLIERPMPDARFENETPREATLADGLTLHGRPDCTIHTDAGAHVLDYKSGIAPKKRDMDAGEDVQLTAYALFYDDAAAVSYMEMGKHRAVTLADAELDNARARLRERLVTFKQDANERPLPAWADDKDCKYCDYPGVCRREAWRGRL